MNGNLGDDSVHGGRGEDAAYGGQDRILDFNAAEGDRIALARGLHYALSSDADGNAAIVFSDTDRVVLQSIRQVSPDWFVLA